MTLTGFNWAAASVTFEEPEQLAEAIMRAMETPGQSSQPERRYYDCSGDTRWNLAQHNATFSTRAPSFDKVHFDVALVMSGSVDYDVADEGEVDQ